MAERNSALQRLPFGSIILESILNRLATLGTFRAKGESYRLIDASYLAIDASYLAIDASFRVIDWLEATKRVGLGL